MKKLKTLKRKPTEVKTMTAAQAYEQACKGNVVILGDSGWQFALIGWRSPTSGKLTGPILVHEYNGVIIEVDREGYYKDHYTATADCYFPWLGKRMSR